MLSPPRIETARGRKGETRPGEVGQGGVEDGAGTADGIDESVRGARETGGMDERNFADGGLSGDEAAAGGAELEDWGEVEVEALTMGSRHLD